MRSGNVGEHRSGVGEHGAVRIGVHGAVEDGIVSVGALGDEGVRHGVAHG